MRTILSILMHLGFYLPILAQQEPGFHTEVLQNLVSESRLDYTIPSNISTLEEAEMEAMKIALLYQYGGRPDHLKFLNLKENTDSTKAVNWAKTYIDNPGNPINLSNLNPQVAGYDTLAILCRKPENKDLIPYRNFFHWIQRFDIKDFVMINIAAGELKMYSNDTLAIEMRIIAGTRQNQTVPMATFADAIMIYPYWTPTRKITVNELLPKIKRNLNYLDRNNFEVIDTKGKAIDPKNLNWKSFSKTNFPYTLRQGTGCDNALGLLKINIQNPYSIYMHDTPHNPVSKSLFQVPSRFFSHGCIRLEKPLELAHMLHPEIEINQELMDFCLINQKPQVIKLLKEIPVFIVYYPDYVDTSGAIVHVPNIYDL